MSLITESIFSHAVALTQSGRMRNSIHVKDKTVYIFNFDRTILLQFTLPAKENPFEKEVNFSASDYDSDDFWEKEGKVLFRKTAGDYTRIKSSTSVDKKFDEIEALWETSKGNPIQFSNLICLTKQILPLMDESLSHVELEITNGEFTLTQKDIYTGAVIRIEKKESGFGLGSDVIKTDCGPYGIRTNDLIAMFSFCDQIEIGLSDSPLITIVGDAFKMEGIIARCLYDELGDIKVIGGTDNGREEPKKRRRQQEADATVGKGSEKEVKTKRRRRKQD